MPLFTRKRIISCSLLLLLLFGAWLYFQRFTRVALENYVPETAVGYVEANDLPHLLENFTNTNAWKQLAPIYGVTNRLQFAGWASRLARWTGIGTTETLLLARGQFALVVYGIEVRGEEVKPRLAVVIETHRSADRVKDLMANRLLQLAQRVYNQPIQETSEYLGVPIVIYREGDRRLLSAGIGSTWIVANDAESLQACIDVRLGRLASMARNNYLVQARTEVKSLDDRSAVFAFVSKSGAARLSQFLTHLLFGRVLAGTPIAGLPEGLVAELAQGTVEALAYSGSFKNGGVQDRYAVLCEPEVISSLRTALRPSTTTGLEQNAALHLVPASAQEVILVKIEDPGQALEQIERVVSAHLGVAQSFLFQRFFSSARRTFLGLEPGESATTVAGTEVVRFSVPSLGGDQNERIWVVAARNRQKLSHLAERLLQQQSGSVKRTNYQGIEITSASNNGRAFAFIGNYLVLSSPKQVIRLIAEREKQLAWLSTEQGATLRLSETPSQALIYSFSSVAQDTEKMMAVVARRLKAKPSGDAALPLQQLPWTTTVTSLTERGVYRESNSPVGNFPLLVTIADAIF
jgi:hypothetical protein